MESNLRSRVAEFEAGYFLPFVLFCCKPALSPFSVGFLKSGGWCLASFVEYDKTDSSVYSQVLYAEKGKIVLFRKLLWR